MIDIRELGTITSGYGKRTSPTAGASSNHKGIDIVLKDKNIPSVTGGTVAASGYSSSAGYYVKIKGDDGFTSTYMHMDSLSPLKIGSKVKEGDTVGIMGNTGISTGTHLHYQVETPTGGTLSPDSYLQNGYAPSSEEITHSGGLADAAMGVVGKVIYFVAILLVLVLAAILFMKAFDIKII